MGGNLIASRPPSAACSPQDPAHWQAASHSGAQIEQGASTGSLSQRSSPGPPIILPGGPARAQAAYQAAAARLQQHQPQAIAQVPPRVGLLNNGMHLSDIARQQHGPVGQQGSAGAGQHPLARPSPHQELQLFRGTLFTMNHATFASKLDSV
jgi:hypothetical protein